MYNNINYSFVLKELYTRTTTIIRYEFMTNEYIPTRVLIV